MSIRYSLQELVTMNKGKRSFYEIVICNDALDLILSREEENLLYNAIHDSYKYVEAGALAIIAESDLVFNLSKILEVSIGIGCNG